MAKLKLSGRKLCTTGRKLSVCGCGGGPGPCCSTSFPCEINRTTPPWFFKTWWDFQSTGQRTKTNPPLGEGCAKGAYSGGYKATAQFPNLATSGTDGFFDAPSTCVVNRVVQTATVFSNQTTNTGTITGDLTFPNTLASSQVQTFAGGATGGWPLQPSGVGAGGDKSIVFTWFVQAQSTVGDEGNGLSGTFQVKLLNGVATIESKPFGSTVTPYLIKEGNCILGAGATFSWTLTGQTCFANGTNTPIANSTLTGTVATAICGLAVGCTNPGSVCASTSPPTAAGASPLLDELDQALFS